MPSAENEDSFQHQSTLFEHLSRAGLNMHHVFDLRALPEFLLQPLAELNIDTGRFRQLIIIGHGGKTLWQSMPKAYFKRAHPIDAFCCDTWQRIMTTEHPNVDYQILYPRHQKPLLHFDLQALGKLAGWHHETPFKVGINPTYGSWFAYRLLIIADSNFTLSPKVSTDHPCDSCVDKPCVSACPVNALTDTGNYDWKKCFSYREQPESVCSDRCLARMACPVAPEHQYDVKQIQYHYNLSRKHLS